MPDQLGDTIADVVAIAGLSAIAVVSMQHGLGEGIMLTCIYAIAGLGGYKMSRRPKR